MQKTMEKAFFTDPLQVPEQLAIIDGILDENKDLAGATMVVLNRIQESIGFISPSMQVYIAKKLGEPVQPNPRRGVFLFILYHNPAREAHHKILHWNRLLCWRHHTDH